MPYNNVQILFFLCALDQSYYSSNGVEIFREEILYTDLHIKCIVEFANDSNDVQ